MKTVTSVEAQNRFGELLDAAQREPVTITRRGRTVAFIMSPEDLKNLVDARATRQSAVAAYEVYRARVAAGAHPAAATISDADVNRMVREARGKR